MSASGKVCTGFSLPYVALYGHTGTTVTYTSGQKLARGVEVSLDVTVADNNEFWADNGVAEIVGGKFQEGTVTLTVDGLLEDTEKLILGLAAPSTVTVGTESVDVYAYNDTQNIPYVGIGYIARFVSDGTVSYVPYVIPKAKFQTPSHSAATEADGSIEYQTQELTANIAKDDTTAHDWLKFAEGQDTEAAAEAVLKELLDIA